jgi:hypothetical protein
MAAGHVAIGHPIGIVNVPHVTVIIRVGVARRPPKWNISPRRCLNPLRFLVFDSETAHELKKSHVPLMKTVVHYWLEQQILN